MKANLGHLDQDEDFVNEDNIPLSKNIKTRNINHIDDFTDLDDYVDNSVVPSINTG